MDAPSEGACNRGMQKMTVVLERTFVAGIEELRAQLQASRPGRWQRRVRRATRGVQRPVRSPAGRHRRTRGNRGRCRRGAVRQAQRSRGCGQERRPWRRRLGDARDGMTIDLSGWKTAEVDPVAKTRSRPARSHLRRAQSRHHGARTRGSNRQGRLGRDRRHDRRRRHRLAGAQASAWRSTIFARSRS